MPPVDICEIPGCMGGSPTDMPVVLGIRFPGTGPWWTPMPADNPVDMGTIGFSNRGNGAAATGGVQLGHRQIISKQEEDLTKSWIYIRSKDSASKGSAIEVW